MNYVKIEEGLIAQGWKPDMVSLWIRLLFMVNHEDETKGEMAVPRGTVMTSRTELMKLTGMTENRLRYILGYWQNHQQICRKSTNKYTILTICNFESYIVDEKQFLPILNQQICQCKEKKEENEEKVTKEKIEKKDKEIGGKKERVSKDTLKKERPKVTDFVDRPGYIPIVTEWLDYKRSRGERYKDLTQLRKMYNNLVNWSGGDPRVAQEMVDISIGNHYQGLVKPRPPQPRQQEQYENKNYWK